MSKPPSTHLFDLITSLTKSEKRYFKLYIQRKISDTNTKYMVLFDAIAKQKKYDEASIIKLRPSLNPKQIPNLKVELYGHILESLRIYHSESSINLKLKSYLEKAEILHMKGLYSQTINILNKAKKTAQKFENYTALVEILRWDPFVKFSRSDESYELETLGLDSS